MSSQAVSVYKQAQAGVGFTLYYSVHNLLEKYETSCATAMCSITVASSIVNYFSQRALSLTSDVQDLITFASVSPPYPALVSSDARS